MIHIALLRVLCCPTCKGELTISDKVDALECTCGDQYPIKNGIPILLRVKERNAYDDLYNQIDFITTPFGYGREYMIWRKGQINKRIVSHLTKGTVLDDGGGYGFLKEFLDQGHNEYYNCDYSYEILKYDNSEYRCVAEGEALPFKDEVFENVVSGDVLEHVQDKVRYLQEACRVLKCNGVFVVNTPRQGWTDTYRKSIWFWIPLLSRIWTRIKNGFSHLSTQSQINIPKGVVDIPSDENWLRDLLEKTGFEIVARSRTDNHLFNLTGVFWRKFADIFINPRKYGHCVLFVCRKTEDDSIET